MKRSESFNFSKKINTYTSVVCRDVSKNPTFKINFSIGSIVKENKMQNSPFGRDG